MIQYTLLTTLAFHHLVIGSVLILFLYGLNGLIKTTPEMRSWIWMTGFIIATLLPFTLFSNEQPIPSTGAPVATTQSPSLTETLITNKQIITKNIIKTPSSETSLWHFPSEVVFQSSGILSLLVIIWIGGSLWRSVQMIGSFIRTRKLIKSCQPLLISDDQFLTNQNNLFSSETISSPMVVGLFSPKIILPNNIIEQLEQNQLAPIVLHEQAHIQRNDIWFGLFQEIIAIIFWWSPVIRILNRRIHIERELACDLRAAQKLSSGKQYAQSLIECAKLMITQQRSLLAMGLFSQKKELTFRITQALNSKKIGQPSLIAILSVCIGLTVTSIHATQTLSPKISIKQTQSDAKHFSLLSQKDGRKLIDAVYKNDIAAIKAMQEQGIDINTPAIGDGTALIIAVKNNNHTMVQALIELGADVNQSSRGDGNPLITAAMNNNLTLAQLLINHGADINGIVKDDETPLINASRRGYFEMTQFLVNNGADVNLEVETGISDGNKIRSPLNMAKTDKIRQYLINMGATEKN
jgi:beta-lactamase regulating signal transducer with metallopeptidase domain